MGVIRSYFDKQATLIRDVTANNSRNKIIELSYGGSNESGSTKISRYIFHTDLTLLQEDITDNSINESQIETHTLRVKNVISLSEDLIGGEYMTARRGSGVDVIVFPLDENFDEGTGFDYIYTTTNYATTVNETPANWTYRQNPTTSWTTEGVYSGTPTEIIGTQRLTNGNEDIEIDVTDYINEVLFSGRTHYGLGIAYSSNTESFTHDKRHVITFFSRHTNTFYEPFIETKLSQTINDSRSNFYLDTDNKLYLYSNVVLDSVDKVEIYDWDDNLYTTIESSAITEVRKNTFEIALNLPSNTFPDLVNVIDKWYYTNNSVSGTVEQEFTTFYKDLFSNSNKHNVIDYNFSFNGLKNNEKISRSSGKRRVEINTKLLEGNSISEKNVLDNIQYRIYTLQGKTQIEVIPYSEVNKTQTSNYFDLDVRWMIPQQYYLELRVVKDNIVYSGGNPIRFNVVSEQEF